MNLGQLFGGAGVVAGGWRKAEEAERSAQQNQLAIEEQNRLADLRAQMARTPFESFQPVDVAQFTQSFVPGQTLPMETVAPPAIAAPAAPAAPTAPTRQPLPAGIQPSQAGAGRGFVNPPLVGQPQAQPTTGFGLPAATEQLGVQFEKAREAHRQAYDALRRYGSRQQLKDPAGYAAAVAAEAQTRQAREAAQTAYESAAAPYAVPVSRGGLQLPTLTAEPPKPAPAAPATPQKPTRQAQQYDNRTTPYDTLMAQSAQQYGIDPVIFKRLIGTESSFSPTAVSPRGEKFGLGIAQIADVHPLTREQRLDPNTAIPFAAQLFAQYLQESGGNYEQAIQRYKGASSERGKAAMAKPIEAILSGVVPSAMAAPATPAAPAPLEVPRTKARNMEMAEFYLANPESIPYELQQISQVAQQQAALLTRQRNEAARLAQVYMRSGTAQGIDAAMRLRDSINQIDTGLLQLQQQVGQKQTYLQGMQGLRELAMANDPRRLAGVLSQYMGATVDIQPRSDGTYNYSVGGKRVRGSLSSAELASMALREFSPEARAASAESARLENELALKRKYGDAMVNAMRDIQKAMIDGEYKIAEERAKQLQGKLTIDTSKGVAYFQRGNSIFVINPDGKVEEIGGAKVETGPSARPVVGLNLGR